MGLYGLRDHAQAPRSVPPSAGTSSTTIRGPGSSTSTSLSASSASSWSRGTSFTDPPYLERVKGEPSIGGAWGSSSSASGRSRRSSSRGSSTTGSSGSSAVVYAGIAVASLVMFVVWELTVDKPGGEPARPQGTGRSRPGRRSAPCSAQVLLFDACSSCRSTCRSSTATTRSRRRRLALMPRSLVMLVTIPDRRRDLQQDVAAARDRVRARARGVHLFPDEPVHPHDEPRGDPLGRR